jgi:hypothetical protein
VGDYGVTGSWCLFPAWERPAQFQPLIETHIVHFVGAELVPVNLHGIRLAMMPLLFDANSRAGMSY